MRKIACPDSVAGGGDGAGALTAARLSWDRAGGVARAAKARIPNAKSSFKERGWCEGDILRYRDPGAKAAPNPARSFGQK
ncbi:hypothetical protein ROR02_17670 [Pararhodospirillum oryzae]|uniref:Uncharacterized protein n=1 Tax=Pararhodospirillum oryzae TaxID=478448 RepID=A0A512H854_9PROT|nr:hypothetical protein ROR02_17670 [Pararhodospirillum oryzae]